MAANTSWGLVWKGSALCFAHGGALIAFSESVLVSMELSHLSWEEFHLLLCVFWPSFPTEGYVALSSGQHGDGGWAKSLCPCPALKDQQGEVCVQRS